MLTDVALRREGSFIETLASEYTSFAPLIRLLLIVPLPFSDTRKNVSRSNAFDGLSGIVLKCGNEARHHCLQPLRWPSVDQHPGRDEQANWTIRGSLRHYEEVRVVGFSQSGVHALSVDSVLIRIWGGDDDGFWSVKGSFRATHVKRAHFHPAAGHLIVFENLTSVRIRELRKNDVD